ncbi:hypothetical protein BDW69DRAFT_187665 [Aspergillus filifer]
MPAATYSSPLDSKDPFDTMRSEPQDRHPLPLRPAGIRPSNPITITCDAHHWPTMCGSCKDTTTEIVNTGIQKSTYTPRLSTLQPNCTTLVIFDLIISAKDLDVATEGHILGDKIHNLLHRWIMVGGDECMRLHMWIRRRPDNSDEDTDVEPKEESKPETDTDQSNNDAGPALRTRARRSAIAAAAAEARAKEKALNEKLLVSVLVDVPAKRPDFEEMRRNLPRGLNVHFPDGDDVIRFENAWKKRPLDGIPDGDVQHPELAQYDTRNTRAYQMNQLRGGKRQVARDICPFGKEPQDPINIAFPP